MRSKKSYYSLILFALILFLSVGYAVVNSVTLTVTGETTSAESTLNVVFTGEKSISNTTKGSAIVEANSTSASFTASNMELNETITFIYEVANKEIDIGARVTANVSGNNEFFSVTLQEVSNVGTTINFDIAPQSTTKIKVKIKMIKTPITVEDSSYSFSIELVSTPIKAEDALPSVSQEIEFIIFSNGSFKAELGMTWEDFVNSEYNTSGVTISGDRVIIFGYAVRDVVKDDYIIANKEYEWEGCCFDAGSKILMADGTEKNIEDVEVGDMVMSLNEDTGEFIIQKVAQTITNKYSTDLVYVHLSNGVRLGMRAYHPLLTTEGWKSLRPDQAETINEIGEVEELKVGDTIIGYEENVTIVSVEQRPEVENYYTYTLNIEGYHNYIVEGIVAHNKGCK